ncbi:MAG: SDR family oxidoreductase [Chitinophagales bacterium]
MKNILVIGGSSGIGLQLVKQLSLNNSANVLATYNKTAPTELLNVQWQQLNVLNDNWNLSLPEQLHGFVYCPGSISLKPFARFSENDFLEDYKLNVTGAIKALQLALPKLKSAESASLVFFSTVAVQLGLNFHAQVAASKGAIEGLTRALAAELAPRIRVNCIAPSLTDTPLSASLLSSPEKREASAGRHALKRIGSVADIANAAEFLLSDKAAWMSGQIIKVDGGMSAVKH